MRLAMIFISTPVLAALLSGCCLKFSDLTPGDSYSVGDTITTAGTDIVVEQFQSGDGNWYSSGSAKVDTRNYARGSGIDITARNTNLHFRFDYPLSKLTFKFGELGGNINIRVNGDFRNERDIVSLNGAVIGGAQVTITSYQEGNNWYGKVTLHGTINDFLVGGQELWLDDVCPEK